MPQTEQRRDEGADGKRGSGRTYRMIQALQPGERVVLLVHSCPMRNYLLQMLHGTRHDLNVGGDVRVAIVQQPSDLDFLRSFEGTVAVDHAWYEFVSEETRRKFTALESCCHWKLLQPCAQEQAHV